MYLKISGMLVGALLFSMSIVEAQQQEEPQSRQLQQLQQEQQEDKKPEQDVVAMVNGDAVTETELEMKLQEQLQGQDVDPKMKDQLRKQTLDSLIESRLIEQHMAKEGPEVKEEEVDSIVNRVKQQLAGQEVSFDQFLASRGLSEKSFEKRIKGMLGWQKYQQEKLKPEELRDYFDENREQFQAENFEEAQQQVAQVYAASLWEDIVKEKKPKAEIKILDEELSQQPQQQEPAAPNAIPK